jgi:anti-sigma regulatory factor (Ser/Thr protein kinase)
MREVDFNDAALAAIESTLADLAGSDEPVRLRFDNHWPVDSEHPALLTAALMGTLRNRPLIVDAVDQDAVDGLLRFGVATALWRRPRGLTEFIGLARGLDRPSLGVLWTSGSRATTEALFASEGGSGTGAVGPRHATFVNPQLSSGIDGHPDIVFLVRRWLTRRLRELSSPRAAEVVEAIGLALDELVANVQEHAPGLSARRPDCLVRLSVDSPDRVRCSVMDTGVGIEASILDKVSDPMEPKERLERLVSGDIPGWDRGRGIGLHRVMEVITEGGGLMTIATATTRLRAAGPAELVAESVDFNLEGTVVDVSLPIGATP